MKKQHRIIVVGAGLAGSIAAAAARDAGADVTVIDAYATFSGSRAAGCLLRPGWLTMLQAREVTLAYALLMKLYGMKRLRFEGNLGIPIDLDWVDPRKILRAADIAGTVTMVSDRTVFYTDTRKTDHSLQADSILIAAGFRTPHLVSMPPITAMIGASLRFTGQLKVPRLKVWAPYRQAIAFNITPRQVWFGDGTSIIEKNWNEKERVDATVKRARELFGLSYKDLTTVQVGARPVVREHPEGYFARRSNSRIWVATGGAKNGTVIAAIHARRFVEEALT